MLTVVRDTVLDPLVELVLPRSCAGCGLPGASLCEACRPVAEPMATRLDGLPVVAASSYTGATRQAVLAYKERGRRDLAAPLGWLVSLAIAHLRALLGLRRAQLLLVGVPSSRAARVRRGGNHVAALTSRAARSTGVRRAPGVLVLQRVVRDSAGLSADDRAGNLDGAMRAGPARVSRSRPAVVLVDDVVTSGATLREARRALRAAGWPVAGAVASAATPLRAADSAAAGIRWYPLVSVDRCRRSADARPATRAVNADPLAAPIRRV